MKKSKTIAKIMISGYYGFNNTGDEAILKSMVRAYVVCEMLIFLLAGAGDYSKIRPEKAGAYYITWD
jgi:hypothetical protein